MVAESESTTSSTNNGGVIEEGGVAVNVRCTNGSKFTVRTNLEATVREFKVLLAANSDVTADQQRLIYKGRILKDDQTLSSYGLQADHTVHMVRGFPSASSTTTTPTATANANASATTPSVTPGNAPSTGSVGTGAVAGAGSALFPGLDFSALGGTGASGMFRSGLPEFDQVQQQLTQNPDMMREIMNVPAIQNLMNNPELMRTLIMGNPQMREIIDRNPELGHILNDPSILRQTLETARNPELMREMMRNTDRAMSNIEASPEGFNMLRRMYENVQEPFLNATTMSGGSGDLASNPFAALLGNQGGAQARNGSNNPSTTESATTGETAAPNANPLPNPWSNMTGGAQRNNATRQTPTGAAPFGGLGGLGLPDMQQMSNGMPDTAMMNQLMQNPAISQMMQSVLSNPEYMNQLVNLNPQLRGMLEAFPQLREMMQNPELLRQLTSPETLQQMMSMQQAILNARQASQGATQPGGTPDLDLLMNMFGGLGASGLGVPNNPDVPPEELYATQLAQLQEMGFFDIAENIRALRATSGNVHAAVERLLGNPGQ